LISSDEDKQLRLEFVSDDENVADIGAAPLAALKPVLMEESSETYDHKGKLDGEYTECAAQSVQSEDGSRGAFGASWRPRPRAKKGIFSMSIFSAS